MCSSQNLCNHPPSLDLTNAMACHLPMVGKCVENLDSNIQIGNIRKSKFGAFGFEFGSRDSKATHQNSEMTDGNKIEQSGAIRLHIGFSNLNVFITFRWPNASKCANILFDRAVGSAGGR